MKRAHESESGLQADKTRKLADEDMLLALLNEAGDGEGVLVLEGRADVRKVGGGFASLATLLGMQGKELAYVPAEFGYLKGMGFEIWMDDEEMQRKEAANPLATALLGVQVQGGGLYGNVFVCKGGMLCEKD